MQHQLQNVSSQTNEEKYNTTALDACLILLVLFTVISLRNCMIDYRLVSRTRRHDISQK